MRDALDGPLGAKIKKQIEFYFSDSNAPRDKFLMEKIRGHPEGYVELALICSFTRMSQALGHPQGMRPEEVPKPTILKVAAVLKDSDSVEVSADNMFVRRKQPLESEEKLCKEIDERSVYAKPLPFDCTLESLTAFFGTLGGVRAVRLRRRPDNKDFKGSLFVELDSPESATKLVAREDVVYEGAVLRMEKKLDYMARKKLSKKQRPADGNPHAHINEPLETNGVKEEPMEEAIEVPSFAPGLVLHFNIASGTEVPEELNYSIVKDAFGSKEGGMVFVEYNKGERVGFVRVSGSEKMKGALGKRDDNGQVLLAGAKTDVGLLDGEEEKQFYLRQAITRRNAERNKAENGKRRPERGRGGRFGKRGRMA